MQPANPQLNKASWGADGPEWVAAGQLIDHILVRYHDVHREQLTELHRLAHLIEGVHGDHPQCPHGLAEHLAVLHQELESHMQKEEQILFPLLKRGLSIQASGPIAVMRREHEDHGEAVAQLQSLTHNLTPVAGACGSWQALYTLLHTFINDLNQHIHLENNILFDTHFLSAIAAHQEVNHG